MYIGVLHFPAPDSCCRGQENDAAGPFRWRPIPSGGRRAPQQALGGGRGRRTRPSGETVSCLKEEGRTVVLTTHYMDEAEALCGQLSIMDRGRVLATGSPQELIRRYLPGAVIELGAEVPLPSDLELPALVRVERSQEGAALISSRLEETLIGLVNWAREHSQPLPGLRTRAATLEDVFLHLTGRSLRD